MPGRVTGQNSRSHQVTSVIQGALPTAVTHQTRRERTQCQRGRHARLPSQTPAAEAAIPPAPPSCERPRGHLKRAHWEAVGPRKTSRQGAARVSPGPAQTSGERLPGFRPHAHSSRRPRPPVPVPSSPPARFRPLSPPRSPVRPASARRAQLLRARDEATPAGRAGLGARRARANLPAASPLCADAGSAASGPVCRLSATPSGSGAAAAGTAGGREGGATSARRGAWSVVATPLREARCACPLWAPMAAGMCVGARLGLAFFSRRVHSGMSQVEPDASRLVTCQFS